MLLNQHIVYHIYPLGLLGAPTENDGVSTCRLPKIAEWIPHLKKLGINTVYFSPLFESDAHGYDTRDYYSVDRRLGTDEDLRALVAALHSAGIEVWLDGVFNHVGRGFFAFQDVCLHRKDSIYKDWFCVSFEGNSPYNDGFWYEGWEGHFELVKLNLKNRAVVDYLLGAVAKWIDYYHIDGLRLDVAYTLDRDFMRELHNFVKERKDGFVLMGEMLFGDYRALANAEMLDSVTNYECYKSLYSALNSDNLYELSYSQNRQFGYEQWCIYRGLALTTFVDNHDVSRFASILQDPRKLAVGYVLLFTICGVPMLYYGSEWGILGQKSDGDVALRPALPAPKWNELTDLITLLIEIRKSEEALRAGGYRNLVEGNKALLFERAIENNCIRVAVNIGDTTHTFYHGALSGHVKDLLSGREIELNGSIAVPAYSAVVLK